MRYIESNSLRAKLAGKAEDWQWGSLFLRLFDLERAGTLLSAWPVNMPPNYLSLVNQSLPKPQLENIRHSVVRSKPLGDALWTGKMVQKYGLQHTVRPEGRPRK